MKIPGGRKKRSWLEHDPLAQACYPQILAAGRAVEFRGEQEAKAAGFKQVATTTMVRHQRGCPALGGGPCRCQADVRPLKRFFAKPACDFCGAPGSIEDAQDWSVYPNTMWQHLSYDLQGNAAHASLIEAGQWAACPPCAALIDADDYAGLTDRCVNAPEGRTLRAGLSKETLAHVRADTARLHLEFRAHRGARVDTHYTASGSSPTRSA